MWLREIFSVEKIEIENAFDMKNKYRNIYEGTTWFYHADYKSLNDCSDYSFCELYAKLDTAATAGWLRTPWYKENYNPNNFQYLAEYSWSIYPPNNLATYDTNNLTLVLQFDGQLYKDKEWVTIDFDENPYNDEILYDVTNITKRYNASLFKSIPVNDLGFGPYFYQGEDKIWKHPIRIRYVKYAPVKIKLKREIGQLEIKKPTGFLLEWYYEDKNGNKVQLKEHKPLFSSEVFFDQYLGSSKQFTLAEYLEKFGGTYVHNETEWYYEDKAGRKNDLKKHLKEDEQQIYPASEMQIIFTHFMEVVYKAITEQRIGLDKFWRISKEIQLNRIHKKLNGQIVYCYHDDNYNDANIENEWDFFAKGLNLSIPNSIPKVPVYNEKINDSLLFEGFRLFYFTFHCDDPFIPIKKGAGSNSRYVNHILDYYRNIFNKDSETAILEAVLSILNMDRKQKTEVGFQIMDKNQKPLKDTNAIISSAQKLVEKLQSIIPLDLYKLFILSTSSTTLLTRLDTIIDPQIRRNNILETCLLNNTCEELRNLLTSLGEEATVVQLSIGNYKLLALISRTISTNDREILEYYGQG